MEGPIVIKQFSLDLTKNVRLLVTAFESKTNPGYITTVVSDSFSMEIVGATTVAKLPTAGASEQSRNYELQLAGGLKMRAVEFETAANPGYVTTVIGDEYKKRAVSVTTVPKLQ